MRKPWLFGLAALLGLAFAAQPVRADDASAGYAKIRPALVKVWAFDGSGKPTQSGSGVVIASDGHQSYVLTALHVVAKAGAVRIDVNRNAHDIVAHVIAASARDLALLRVDRALATATLAPHNRTIVEGNMVAVAGFVKQDELIGIDGQEPRLLYPGTISSRPDDGAYLELENLHVEEGFSGGPVFDPHSGEVLGIVTTRTIDQRGGFAVSVPAVVLAFVQANGVLKSGAPPVVAAATPKPAPAPVAVATPKPVPVVVAVAKPAALVVPASIPAPVSAPVAPRNGPTLWQGQDVPAKRFAFDHGGCAVVVTVKVSALVVALTGNGMEPNSRRPALEVSVARSVAPTFACEAIQPTPAYAAVYQPRAWSYDGHHLTVRYAYEGVDRSSAGSNDLAFPDQSLFPSDVSLDADMSGSSASATIQFLADDWNGVVELPLERADSAQFSQR